MKRKLQENIRRVQHQIEEACARANRPADSVVMVAVTKNASLDIVRTLVDLGVTHLGENRVQELTKRAAMVNEWLGRRSRDLAAGARPRPTWHMVGHLQRNKAKALLPWVDVIHSVDSLRLAEDLDAQSAKLERITPIFMQVNVAGEAQKGGVAVAAALHLAEQFSTLPNIQLRGMMVMAPLTDDKAVIRNVFERTRELYDEIVGERIGGSHFRALSMGMSNDFQHAIEFGATHIRIGAALLEGIDLGVQQEAVSDATHG